MRAMMDANDFNTPQGKAMQKVTAIQAKYFNIQILLQIPFFSFATFLIYKNAKLNYAEHLTLHSFVMAQTTLVSIILMLFIFLIDHDNLLLLRSYFTISGVISFLYQVRIYMLFFREKTFKGFLKAVITYVIGFLFFLISAMLLTTIGLLIYGLVTGKI
jgi:hypothetical protein